MSDNIISSWIEWDVEVDGDSYTPSAVLIIATDLPEPGAEDHDPQAMKAMIDEALEAHKADNLVIKRVRLVPVEEDVDDEVDEPLEE